MVLPWVDSQTSTWVGKVACDNSSLLCKFVNYGRKKLNNFGPRLENRFEQTCILFPIKRSILNGVYLQRAPWVESGRAISNWREPKSCLAWVFNFKSGSLDQ